MFREDDEWAVNCRPQPGRVGVPPLRASLARYGEVVYVGLARLDGALSDVLWAVGPATQELSYPMPETINPSN